LRLSPAEAVVVVAEVMVPLEIAAQMPGALNKFKPQE
jgi:hypothetical protein